MSVDSSLRRIFNDALDRKDASERSHFLNEACAGDRALREQIERLLTAHNSAGSFLAKPECAMRPEERLAVEQPGQRIGRYKLLERIGEGGCGVVYMAEQEEPVRRKVALKIIKLGMDTRAVIARFESERQALAMMDHPNIAKVLDAGATETGRPYFVMELVHGVKITDYCDQNNLTTEDRLRLFVHVCKAVQHAHQKGIIHRDIKPANILVTPHDGVPVPKVIDFGIAKATGQERLTDRTVFTSFQQFIGTPAYMSPEQAEMSGLDIDTRSDIYSLGVLLYELLTGRTPFDSRELLAAGLDGMRKTIREQEPVLPSTRLNAMIASELTTVAGQRQTAPPRLIHLLQGDLDWVVMKCLEKDRTRRYGTAIEPALDIERYLRDEPVTARPVTRLYRFQKLVRRNKAAFAAAGTVAGALILGASVSTRLYIRERVALKVAAENEKRAQVSAANEAQQRVRAEGALTHLEMERAELLFGRDDASSALAYLARLLRHQPTNHAVADRLISALTHRTFCVPLIPPLVHGPALRRYQGWNSQAMRHPLMTAQSITAARFSPDGKLILTASRDGTAIIWNAATGQPLRDPFQHTDEVLFAEFSPDGSRIITACRDRRAYIWSVAKGNLLTAPLAHDGPVTYAEFSPDGERVVTASEDGTAKIWSSVTGELLAPALEHSDTVVAAHFSPDGRSIVTASYDKSARVWNAVTGRPFGPPLQQSNALLFGNFSPNGKQVVAGGFAWTVSVWNGSSGESIIHSAAHQENIFAAAFSSDGGLVMSAAADNKVRFWDTIDGKLLPRFIQHDGPIRSLAVSTDGKMVATASDDTTARVWNVNTGLALTEPINHDRAIRLVAFSPNSRALLSVSENRAFVWEIRSQQGPAVEFPSDRFALRIGRFTPDSTRVFTGGALHAAGLWDVQDSSLIARFRHNRFISAVDFSSDGKALVTGSMDGTAKVWDLDSLLLRRVFKHTNWIRSARFSPNGHLLLTAGTDKTAKLWDIHSGSLLWTTAEEDAGSAADFSPDGRHFVVGFGSGTAQIWKTDTRQKIGPLLKHEGAVTSARYSRDGSMIVTASTDKTARLWNAQTGKLLLPLRHEETVASAEFNFADTLVLTTAGNNARIWHCANGVAHANSLRHEARVNSATFSPSGRFIVTSSDDCTVRIWDGNTAYPVSEPLRHPTSVASAEFSPDGKWIVSVDKNGSARIWEAPVRSDSLPPWLPGLAEAFAGQQLNAENEFEPLPTDELWTLSRSLLETPPNDASSRWVHWLFADSSSRTASASSIISREENVRRLEAHGLLEAASTLVYSNRLEEAIAQYSRILAITPDAFRVYMYRGNVYVRLAQFDLAEADYRAALALAPDRAGIYNNIACYYILGPLPARVPEKALPLARRAVELSKGHWNFLNTLGIVYFRLERWQDAIETLQAAVEANDAGGHANDYFFLAMTYFRLGESTRAKEFYAKGLEWQKANSSSESPFNHEETENHRIEAAALLGMTPAVP